MNPIMMLLNSFDRLINEHGSAAILRERLTLAADQYALVEKENIALKSENEILKTENNNLKTENYNLKQENQNFKRRSSPTGIAIVDLHDPNLDKI